MDLERQSGTRRRSSEAPDLRKEPIGLVVFLIVLLFLAGVGCLVGSTFQ